jgi:hypothetical protein
LRDLGWQDFVIDTPAITQNHPCDALGYGQRDCVPALSASFSNGIGHSVERFVSLRISDERKAASIITIRSFRGNSSQGIVCNHASVLSIRLVNA